MQLQVARFSKVGSLMKQLDGTPKVLQRQICPLYRTSSQGDVQVTFFFLSLFYDPLSSFFTRHMRDYFLGVSE